jgi:hypothetical protein
MTAASAKPGPGVSKTAPTPPASDGFLPAPPRPMAVVERVSGMARLAPSRVVRPAKISSPNREDAFNVDGGNRSCWPQENIALKRHCRQHRSRPSSVESGHPGGAKIRKVRTVSEYLRRRIYILRIGSFVFSTFGIISLYATRARFRAQSQDTRCRNQHSAKSARTVHRVLISPNVSRLMSETSSFHSARDSRTVLACSPITTSGTPRRAAQAEFFRRFPPRRPSQTG